MRLRITWDGTKAVLVGLAAAIAFVGVILVCANALDSADQRAAQEETGKSQLGDPYDVKDFHFQWVPTEGGREVPCMVWRRGTSNPSGLSCDWDASRPAD